MSVPQPRPITILIAALGGEGGGVLTDWIVSAAAQLNFPVQSTSIPGVAQRTGATPYYIEIVPVPARELPARPVLALAPGVGDVDIVLASELMEAGRTIAGGFVTPDRTLMIASTGRSYLVVEKMAMGDAGDRGRLHGEAELAGRRHDPVREHAAAFAAERGDENGDRAGLRGAHARASARRAVKAPMILARTPWSARSHQFGLRMISAR